MRSNLLLIVFLLIFAATGYVWYSYGKQTPEVETAEAEYQDFLRRVSEARRITQIELDTAVLEDPLFRMLESPARATTTFGTPGRKNPFAPF